MRQKQAHARIAVCSRSSGWRRLPQLRQLACRLGDHVDAALQPLLQIRNVHLVGDAIGVADALDVAVLHHFLQAAQHRGARQVQRVRDRAGGNGRAHERAQEHIDADGAEAGAVAMGGKRRSVIVADAADEAEIEAAHQHALARQRDARRRADIVDQHELGAEVAPGARGDVVVWRRRCVLLVGTGHGRPPILARGVVRQRARRVASTAMVAPPPRAGHPGFT